MHFRRWHLVLQFDNVQFIIRVRTVLFVCWSSFYSLFLIVVAAVSNFVFFFWKKFAAHAAIVRNRRATNLTKEIDFRDWNIQPVSSICLNSGVQRYYLIYLFSLLLLFHFRKKKWSDQVDKKQQLLLKLLWENEKKMCVAKNPTDRFSLTVLPFVLVLLFNISTS